MSVYTNKITILQDQQRLFIIKETLALCKTTEEHRKPTTLDDHESPSKIHICM